MKKVLFKIEHSLLYLCKIFGINFYKKATKVLYSRYGVIFDGIPGYIDINVNMDIFGGGTIHIGEGTTITYNSILLTHDYSAGLGITLFRKSKKYYKIKRVQNIKIGKHCFIGQRTIILPGVNIGDNVLVAAGSVVTKSLPSNVVAAGNPCRIIESIEEYGEKLESRLKNENQIDNKAFYS